MVHARRQLETMIRRDWNHPSVIFWSVSNETHEDQPVVVEGNTALMQLARALDPTRLVVHVSDHSSPRHGNYYYFDTDDVICLNDYPWEFDAGMAEVARISEMGDYWVTYLAKVRAAYPNKPILITEFGYRSFEGVFDNVSGEDRHALALEAQLAVFTPPDVCGALIWCYADHAWSLGFRADRPRHVTLSPYGVVTRRRAPKTTVYQTVKRIFTARKDRSDPL
jgi:beta-glucuronidase